MDMGRESVTIVRSDEGQRGRLGGISIRSMVPGVDSGGRFALIEHPLEPHALAAPLHRHSREDEFSYVIRGRIGVQLGQQTILAGPGDVVFKPRGQWHTFWNSGDESASLLEIISPGGFEGYFEDVIALFRIEEPAPEKLVPIAQRYGLELDFRSIGELCTKHGLRFG